MSLKEIEDQWSMLDLLQANQVLNAIAVAEERAEKLAKAQTK